MGSGDQSFDVFFSYHWRDHVPVEAVARTLTERGVRVFLDRWYLTPGTPWPQALERTLASCKSVAVFLGTDGLGPWQQRERDLALDRQGQEPGFPVIPVLLTRADPALGFLKLNTWVDLSANVADQAALEILCAGIRRQSPGPAGLQHIAAVRAEICPYRGLRPFREEDAAYFCGREAFTGKLVEAIERSSLVAVMGASGSGKSSVVRAGLIPRLRQTKVGQTWEIATLVPTDRPLHSLAAALVPILEPEMTRIDRLAEINKLAGHFAEGAVALRDVTADVLRAQPGTDRLLLFVDQWEELYTLVADDGARRRFLAEVLDASATRVVSVVLTLRGDFFGQALSDRTLADRLQDGQVNLGPMTQEELRRSIVNPAEKAGLQFEPGLVDRILEDVGQEPGNLPLLEFVLAALWEQRQAVTLLHAAYERMGGVEGAIAARANAEFEKLDAAQKDAARRVLIQMVRPGEGTEDTRQRALLPSSNETALAVIRRLADARLVVTARNAATGEETVEVTHEALIRNWTLLRGWVDADREFLRTKARIEAAEELWEKENRDPSRLLAEGRPLAEAEEILARRRQELSLELIEFIEASAAHARRDRQRKRVIAGGVMAALALLAGVAAWFGYDATLKEREALAQSVRAEQQRQIAVARQLAAQASILADRGGSEASIERAAALAVESWRRLHNPEAADAAERIIRMLPSARIDGARTIEVQDVAFSPDSRLLAATGSGSVRLIETASSKEVVRIEHSDPAWAVDFSPDGRWLATGWFGETARLIETASGKELARIENGKHVEDVAYSAEASFLAAWVSVREPFVQGVPFSPDGRWLVTISKDGAVRLTETASGREVVKICDGCMPRVAFSADSRLFAASDETAGVIETASGKVLARIEGWFRDVAFSPDGRFLFAHERGTDGKARVIETASGEEVCHIEYGHEIDHVAFSPDGRFLAMASNDEMALLIETLTGKELARIEGPFVAFSPDSLSVVTAGKDGTARMIEAATGKELTRIQLGPVMSVVFSPDIRLLATRSSGNPVRLFETATGKEVARIHHDSGVRRGEMSVGEITFSPDGRWLATAAYDGTVRLTETASGREVAFIEHWDASRVAFSSDGHWIATATEDDNTTRLIETGSGKEVVRVEFGARVNAVEFSADGRLLAAASADGDVRLIETATGKEVAGIEHVGRVFRLAFSPDGHWLATESLDEKTARLIETATGKLARIEQGQLPNNVAFSPDGRWLATVSRDEAARLFETRLTEPATGKEVARINGLLVAISPDSRFLAWLSDEKTARLFETAIGKEVARIEHEGEVTGAAFSSDGHGILTMSDDTVRLIETATGKETARISSVAKSGFATSGVAAISPDFRFLATRSDDTVRLIETATGKETARIEHGGSLWTIDFSPDGRWLATASEEGMARLIETASGQEVAHIAVGGGGEYLFLGFSPGGHFLYIVSRRSALVIWADPQHVFDALCAKAGRNLSVDEWQTYIGADEPWRPTCPSWRNPEAPTQAR